MAANGSFTGSPLRAFNSSPLRARNTGELCPVTPLMSGGELWNANWVKAYHAMVAVGSETPGSPTITEESWIEANGGFRSVMSPPFSHVDYEYDPPWGSVVKGVQTFQTLWGIPDQHQTLIRGRYALTVQGSITVAEEVKWWLGVMAAWPFAANRWVREIKTYSTLAISDTLECDVDCCFPVFFLALAVGPYLYLGLFTRYEWTATHSWPYGGDAEGVQLYSISLLAERVT